MEDKNIQLASDEERRRAEAKQVTLQPLHEDVTPDPRPDAEIVANHMTSPAIGNATNDTEETKSFLQPSREVADQAAPEPEEHRDNPQTLKFILITGIVVIVAVAAFFVAQSL